MDVFGAEKGIQELEERIGHRIEPPLKRREAKIIYAISRGGRPVLAVGLLASLASLPIITIAQVVNHSRLMGRVEKLADTNRDGQTSDEEWREAYNLVGLTYSRNEPWITQENAQSMYDQLK